ncbi:hypothetical protein L4174_024005 (plasmid) [Photobacterium sp. CCB-ST2H9]|uniref:hypothetical protein n=1 Tax=Photobacterium sp. CCB-ST2H9 TaxID=2912855 RepID=UPI0020043922|nr:hypothetical protein [Photobacterium sp. CCB-ST2H9]UTM60451.1 hypothetical protein L4174_024005 [Photobacterium sp. CCB-ST2H9]
MAKKNRFNPDQLLIISKHLGTRDDIANALSLYFIDGLSMYAAEKSAGIPKNTLRKKIKRIEKELAYIERFNQASTEEFQLKLV